MSAFDRAAAKSERGPGPARFRRPLPAAPQALAEVRRAGAGSGRAGDAVSRQVEEPGHVDRKSAETAVPRDTSISRSSTARPRSNPLSNPWRRCDRNSGASSGPVPSRAPSAPTRSSTAQAVVQPGNARLESDSR